MILTFLAMISTADAAIGDPDWELFDTDPENTVTLTLSPLHLGVPMVEAMAELEVGNDRSVALIGGLGTEERRWLYTFGGQVKQYVAGDFDTGLSLGAEAKYGNADMQGFKGGTVSAGPFLGAKGTLGVLSLEAQGGGQLVYNQGRTSIAPLVNLNAGVSF